MSETELSPPPPRARVRRRHRRRRTRGLCARVPLSAPRAARRPRRRRARSTSRLERGGMRLVPRVEGSSTRAARRIRGHPDRTGWMHRDRCIAPRNDGGRHSARWHDCRTPPPLHDRCRQRPVSSERAGGALQTAHIAADIRPTNGAPSRSTDLMAERSQTQPSVARRRSASVELACDLECECAPESADVVRGDVAFRRGIQSTHDVGRRRVTRAEPPTQLALAES